MVQHDKKAHATAKFLSEQVLVRKVRLKHAKMEILTHLHLTSLKCCTKNKHCRLFQKVWLPDKKVNKLAL